jgi:hypothetical protein
MNSSASTDSGVQMLFHIRRVSNVSGRICKHISLNNSVRKTQYCYLPLKLQVLIHIFILFSLALQPNSGLGHLHETFHFTSVTRSRTDGRIPWTGDHLVARPLPVHKHRKTHTQHKH